MITIKKESIKMLNSQTYSLQVGLKYVKKALAALRERRIE